MCVACMACRCAASHASAPGRRCATARAAGCRPRAWRSWPRRAACPSQGRRRSLSWRRWSAARAPQSHQQRQDDSRARQTGAPAAAAAVAAGSAARMRAAAGCSRQAPQAAGGIRMPVCSRQPVACESRRSAASIHGMSVSCSRGGEAMEQRGAPVGRRRHLRQGRQQLAGRRSWRRWRRGMCTACTTSSPATSAQPVLPSGPRWLLHPSATVPVRSVPCMHMQH